MSVVLSECYDIAVKIFKKEASDIRSLLDENFVAIHHIGSTAIPNLIAKPQIDIALEVYNLDKSLILKENGFVYKGELNIPFRYFFGKNEGEMKTNLHILEKGNPEIKGFLMFRDYMIEHTEVVLEYSELKRKISIMKDASEKKSYGLPTYTLMKNDFIRKILRKAGFKEPCIRYPVHYSEIEYIGQMDPDFTYVIFYKGPDIVGFSSFCEKSGAIEQFNVEQKTLCDYFLDKVKIIANRNKMF
ncbi:MAG: GrpB family protein [Holosporales bacterium]|jgi:GrpB-like predicted nucleotidyltransferase (UPF0157 family)|nr:GrpB family protein [Holosporales bacterium]